MNAIIRNILFILSAGVLLLLFQQCAEYSIQQKIDVNQPSIKSHTDSLLPPPKKKIANMRVMFFVDQSYSMLQGQCPSDIDGEGSLDLKGNTVGCTPERGIDPEAHRFSAIQEWLDELKAGGDDLSGIKVSIIPFSGGLYARPRNDGPVTYDKQYFKFLDLNDAQDYLNKLREEHNADFANLVTSTPMTQNAGSGIYMGTSAPYKTLNQAYKILDDEMKNLKDNEQLEVTPVHFIYLSDGAFKPLEQHLHKVLLAAGCPISCAADPGHWVCGSSDGWKYTGQDPKKLCQTDIPYNFKTMFGDPAENQFDNTESIIKQISDLSTRYNGSNMKTHLVKIHPERMSALNLNKSGEMYKGKTVYRNLFDEIYDRNDNIKKYNLTSGHKLFSLAAGGAMLSYRLENFYALNLNAFFNSYGQLQIDSDGDGLSDQQEISLGYDPANSRTNGYCLDGIDTKFGCKKFGCDPTLDYDGDGLNQCEEIVLSSNREKADTDEDNILEPHEFLKELSPVFNERTLFSSGDKYSDPDHFYHGVSPLIKLVDAPKIQQINFQIEESEQYEPHPLQPDFYSKSYSINVNSIPLVKTGSALAAKDLFKKSGGPKIKDDQYLMGQAHKAGENEILFLAKITSNEDPNKFYWLVHRVKVSYLDNFVYVQDIEINFNDFIQLDLK